ncbi:MAG: biotin--[Oscillospiraceae bacterium]|nr:biotin--[acetyl-CoA-carboxylase] ligase [Oscillospiraceae bacterium]
MKEQILSHLNAECPWRDTLHWYSKIDSTNAQASTLAKSGAPHGTVLIADTQTAGKGRMGRSFCSPAGMGVYLSAILRPNCTPDKLMHLTCAAAVAASAAIEKVSGIAPNIKWTNDLVIGRKKLGGILTELGLDDHGTVSFAIIGIGINCCQRESDFPPELQDMATSLAAIGSKSVTPAILAAALTESLWQMSQHLLTDKKALIDAYRSRCMTVGQDVVLLQGESRAYGRALDLDANGGLIVRFADGQVRTVTSGEISVRGMYGYI